MAEFGEGIQLMIRQKKSRTFFKLLILVTISLVLLACTTEETIPITETAPKILSVTQTSSPYPTQTFTPTFFPNKINYQATADLLTNGRVCEGAVVMGTSPNKDWAIINCDPNPSEQKSITKIIRLDKTASWEISFYEIYGVYADIGDGYISAIHWSNDGNYVYLRPSFCCVDAPENIFFNFFGNSIGVYRLNLFTGETTTSLRPSSESLVASYAVSFSSTERFLAYTHSSNVTEINIQNLQTGELKKIVLNSKFNASGMFSWSPDDKKLIVVATTSNWQPYGNALAEDSVSYFIYDVETEEIQLLFNKSDLYRPSWLSNEKLEFNPLFENEKLVYDLQSHTYIQVTPTP